MDENPPRLWATVVEKSVLIKNGNALGSPISDLSIPFDLTLSALGTLVRHPECIHGYAEGFEYTFSGFSETAFWPDRRSEESVSTYGQWTGRRVGRAKWQDSNVRILE